MNKEEQFEKALNNYDQELIISFLKDKNFIKICDVSANNNWLLRWACEKNIIPLFDILIKDKRVDPSDWYNQSLILACKNNSIYMVNELLKDSRVDPSDEFNQALNISYKNKNIEIVKMLCNFESVRSVLQESPFYEEISKFLLSNNIRDF